MTHCGTCKAGTQ